MADMIPAIAAVQEFPSAETAASAAEQLTSLAQQSTSAPEPVETTTEALTVPSVPTASASVAVVSVSSSAQAQMTQGESPNAVQVTAVDADDFISGQTETHQWPGSDELTLEFSADCWVEVEHLGGEESYRNQFSAGDTLVIRGTAPFSVLLGNARTVALTFNGRSMDISSNVRADNTARLSIGM
jgi:cytoskeleton protein RodZ